MYAAQTTLVFVVAMALMLSIDARLTLIALVPLPLVSVFVKLFGSAIHRRFEKIQAQLSEISAVAQENAVRRSRGPRLRAGGVGARAVQASRTTSTSPATAA